MSTEPVDKEGTVKMTTMRAGRTGWGAAAWLLLLMLATAPVAQALPDGSPAGPEPVPSPSATP